MILPHDFPCSLSLASPKSQYKIINNNKLPHFSLVLLQPSCHNTTMQMEVNWFSKMYLLQSTKDLPLQNQITVLSTYFTSFPNFSKTWNWKASKLNWNISKQYWGSHHPKLYIRGRAVSFFPHWRYDNSCKQEFTMLNDCWPIRSHDLNISIVLSFHVSMLC